MQMVPRGSFQRGPGQKPAGNGRRRAPPLGSGKDMRGLPAYLGAARPSMPCPGRAACITRYGDKK
jgi:hypothetical protein